jgi:hypothetical protein
MSRNRKVRNTFSAKYDPAKPTEAQGTVEWFVTTAALVVLPLTQTIMSLPWKPSTALSITTRTQS